MQTMLTTVLDFLFPPRKDARVVSTLTDEALFSHYVPTRVESSVALSRYEHEVVRALIHEAKFHENVTAWKHLHTLLTHYLRTLPHREYTIIPTPLSSKRRRKRGYNQIEKILTILPLPQHMHVETNVLIRTKDTVPQTSLSRAKRLTNLDGAFSVQKPACIRGKHILIIDDVTTTGATLSEIRRTLRPHRPATLTSIALAH